MRIIGPLAAGCLVSFCWPAAAASQDGGRAASMGMPCNDLCAWWMSIGEAPEATAPGAPGAGEAQREDAIPPAAGPSSVDAPSAPRRPPTPVARHERIGPHGHPPLLEARSAPPLVPPRAEIPLPPSLWGVPIAGSAPVLTARFVRP